MKFNPQRAIFLAGSVSPPQVSQLIAQMFMYDRQSDEDIWVIIDSYGGCATSCLNLIQAMKTVRSDVATLSLGKSMSAGAFTASGGTVGKRFGMPNCSFMYHSTVAMTDFSNASISHIDGLDAWVRNYLVDKTGRPMDELAARLDRDAHFSTEQAIQFGLIDKIYTGE